MKVCSHWTRSVAGAPPRYRRREGRNSTNCLNAADFITLHTRYDEEAQEHIDEAAIAKMKKARDHQCAAAAWSTSRRLVRMH